MNLRKRQSIRRGLSLLELLQALTITGLVAVAVSGMMAAVTTGVTTHRDNRAVMVSASAASARLNAYINTARCVLDKTSDSLVIWHNDDRVSGTVHATEIRWITYDDAEGAITVTFVSFPEEWTEAARDLADAEHAASSNWSDVLAGYEAAGHTTTFAIVDMLDDVTISTDEADAGDVQHMNFDLSFQTTAGTMNVHVAATIRLHKVPSS
jgi:type II secretory pathway pseudopilin PulG